MLALALALFLSSCAVTTAPTESSTETLDKTVNATLDVTSSTSPGSSDSGSAGLENFTRENFIALKSEMAAGEGEHLAALAGLMQIRETETFYHLVRQNYTLLFPQADTTPEQMLVTLDLLVSHQPVAVL